MKRRQSITLLLAGLAPVSRSHGAKAEAMEAAAQLIQKQIDARLLDSAVLHVRRGDDIFQRAFGKTATTDSMFLLGSITKPFTSPR